MRRFPVFAAFPLLLAAAALAEGADDGPGAGGQPAPQAPATPARDTLTLSDGRKLEGEIVAEDERYVTLRCDGVTRAYARDSITSISRAPRTASPADAAGTPAPAPAPGKDKKKAGGDRRDAPLSESAKAWLRDLIARTADPDEAVRRSAGAAIGALGPQAVPLLREALAALPDGPQKEFLGRLAADLETRRDRRMRGEGGDPMGPAGEPGRAGPGRRGIEAMVQRLAEELELTAEQKPKVETVLEETMRRHFEILREHRGTATPEEIAEKLAPVRTDMLARMKALLTEPQYALFEGMAARLMEMQRPPHPPMPPAPRPPEPAK